MQASATARAAAPGSKLLVGVGRAREGEVALAAVARLAAREQLARALEVAAARTRERQAGRAAELERGRDLGGGERREAHGSQRERTVASRRCGCAQTRITTAWPGGSSIDFRSAFWTTSGIVSASQIR